MKKTLKKIFNIFIFTNFIFTLFFYNFKANAQIPVSEKDLINCTFELSYKTGEKWESYAKIKFKKYKVATLMLYASNRQGENLLLPGTAIWDMIGDKLTMIGNEAVFRTLISENPYLSKVPNPTNVFLASTITRQGNDFLVTTPIINWAHDDDSNFETKMKRKPPVRQVYKLKKL